MMLSSMPNATTRAESTTASSMRRIRRTTRTTSSSYSSSSSSSSYLNKNKNNKNVNNNNNNNINNSACRSFSRFMNSSGRSSGNSSRERNNISKEIFVGRRRGQTTVVVKAGEQGDAPVSKAAKKVNIGLEKFEAKQYQEAAAFFTDALMLNPNEEESRASHYNRACAYVKMNKFEQAKDDLVVALEKFDLDFRVLRRDDDLAMFRSTEQFEEIDAEFGDRKEKQAAQAKLRAEAAEPFRFLKLFTFGSLATGAIVGLFIILSRLVQALKGGGGEGELAEDVPDLIETLKNLGVNTTALVVLGLLLKNELKGRDATLQQAEREEELGRLQVQLKKDEGTVPLNRLRSLYRVFVVAGSEAHIFETMANLEKFKEKFIQNKILVCTVTMLENDGKPTGDEPMDLTFGNRSRRNKKSSSSEVEVNIFADAKERWRIQAQDQTAWRRWIINQVEVDGFDPTVRDVFFAIAKNGTLWKSGAGVPNWMKLLEELPEEGSVQASVTGI